jgi:hypothetical protein
MVMRFLENIEGIMDGFCLRVRVLMGHCGNPS